MHQTMLDVRPANPVSAPGGGTGVANGPGAAVPLQRSAEAGTPHVAASGPSCLPHPRTPRHPWRCLRHSWSRPGMLPQFQPQQQHLPRAGALSGASCWALLATDRHTCTAGPSFPGTNTAGPGKWVIHRLISQSAPNAGSPWEHTQTQLVALKLLFWEPVFLQGGPRKRQPTQPLLRQGDTSARWTL